LLVGKTAINASTTGIQIEANGTITATRAGRPFILNRTNTDGDLIELRKNNAKIGSIGSKSGNTFIDLKPGAGGAGFRGGDAKILPYVNNADSDATVDIGNTGARFKNLYLSGTANAGGVTVDGNTTNLNYGKTFFTNGLGANKWQIWNDNGGADKFQLVDGDGHLVFQAEQSGDISFYEDTGTTPKFQWFASNERLVLKTSGAYALDVQASGNSSVTMARFSNSNASDKAAFRLDANGDGELVLIDAGNNEDVVITAGGDSYFNGGNVGIGTSSPSGPLNVHSASGDTNLYITTGNTAASTNIFFGDSGNSTIGRIVYDHNGDYMKFRTNGSDAMRIDANGNVGIGESDPDSTLTVKGSAHTNFQVKSNSESTKAFIQTVQDSDVRIGSSTNHPVAFYQNGSERARIDSSGQVGIGTSSPTEQLDVQLNAIVNESGANDKGLFVGPSGFAGSFVYKSSGDAEIAPRSGKNLLFAASTGGTERMRIDSSGIVQIGPSGSTGDRELRFETGSGSASGEDAIINSYRSNADLILKTNDTEAMRITSAGELQLTGNGVLRNQESGGNFSYLQQTSSDARLFVQYSQPLLFGTNNTERARIDTSGRLLVGQTSGVGIGGTPADVNGIEIGPGYINLNRDDTASATQIQFGKNGSVAGSIVTTTSTTYNTTSDRRAKENIADADDAGAIVDSIQVRKFDWKDDGTHQRYGMIAQELLESAPEVVHQPETEEDMMGVDYSKLVPMLVKEIQSLRARVAQLEGEN
jgi:hypothetical protein